MLVDAPRQDFPNQKSRFLPGQKLMYFIVSNNDKLTCSENHEPIDRLIAPPPASCYNEDVCRCLGDAIGGGVPVNVSVMPGNGYECVVPSSSSSSVLSSPAIMDIPANTIKKMDQEKAMLKVSS
jgi:hypothetical protein